MGRKSMRFKNLKKSGRNIFLPFAFFGTTAGFLLIYVNGCGNLGNVFTDEVTRIYYTGAEDLNDGRPYEDKYQKKQTPYSILDYQLKIEYPADSLIHFYEEKLKTLGYEPIGDSKWVTGHEQTTINDGRSAPCFFRYRRNWSNSNKTRIASLYINFNSPMCAFGVRMDCPYKPDNSDAFVQIESWPNHFDLGAQDSSPGN